MYFPLQTRDERELYLMLTAQMAIIPEDTYLRVLCCLAPYVSDENRVAESHSFDGAFAGRPNTYHQSFEDYQMDFDTIKRKVYAWVAKHEDVHDIVEVEAGSQPIHGTV